MLEVAVPRAEPVASALALLLCRITLSVAGGETVAEPDCGAPLSVENKLPVPRAVGEAEAVPSALLVSPYTVALEEMLEVPQGVPTPPCVALFASEALGEELGNVVSVAEHEARGLLLATVEGEACSVSNALPLPLPTALAVAVGPAAETVGSSAEGLSEPVALLVGLAEGMIETEKVELPPLPLIETAGLPLITVLALSTGQAVGLGEETELLDALREGEAVGESGALKVGNVLLVVPLEPLASALLPEGRAADPLIEAQPLTDSVRSAVCDAGRGDTERAALTVAATSEAVAQPADAVAQPEVHAVKEAKGVEVWAALRVAPPSTLPVASTEAEAEAQNEPSCEAEPPLAPVGEGQGVTVPAAAAAESQAEVLHERAPLPLGEDAALKDAEEEVELEGSAAEGEALGLPVAKIDPEGEPLLVTTCTVAVAHCEATSEGVALRLGERDADNCGDIEAQPLALPEVEAVCVGMLVAELHPEGVTRLDAVPHSVALGHCVALKESEALPLPAAAETEALPPLDVAEGGAPVLVPKPPLCVGSPLIEALPDSVNALLPLRTRELLRLPLALEEAALVSDRVVCGEGVTSGQGVAEPDSESTPEAVVERVLLVDAVPKADVETHAAADAVKMAAEDDPEALPPRAPPLPLLPLLEGQAVSEGGCEGEPVVETESEEKKETEREPVLVIVALPLAEAEKSALGVLQAEGHSLRLELREGSCTLPVAGGEADGDSEDRRLPLNEEGGDGVPLPPVAAAEPLPAPPPEAVPLRLEQPLLLALTHSVPPPASVVLAHAEAHPLPPCEMLGSTEAVALVEAHCESVAAPEGEFLPLAVDPAEMVRAELLLRSALPLLEGHAVGVAEREGLSDPDPQRELLSEADAQPDPVALRVELLEPLAHAVSVAKPLAEYVPGPLLVVAQREVLTQPEEEGERLPGGAVAVGKPLPVAAPLLQADALQLRVAVPQRDALPLTEAQAVEVCDTAGEAEAEGLSAVVGEKRPECEAEAHTVPLEEGVERSESVALPAVALGDSVALSDPARPPEDVAEPLLLGADEALPPPPPPPPLPDPEVLTQGDAVSAAEIVPPLLSEGLLRAVWETAVLIENAADCEALPEELPPPVPLLEAESHAEDEAQTLCVRLPEGLAVVERETLPQPDEEGEAVPRSESEAPPLPVAMPLLQPDALIPAVEVAQRELLPLLEEQDVPVGETEGEAEAEAQREGLGQELTVVDAEAQGVARALPL